ncbi:lipid phosphate phosphatase 1 [Crepidotus variabilis]|uniref:Lipid phosphate phosphatase 1 n=1 Tax=Crepidotus variabilis TaxID=179855 RepID=A0A9P6JSE6_9AGAR|nr:lipid phosphate phosphatase 1 [Crepidotus variabilis]
MSKVRELINRHFGPDALVWFDRAYLVDWVAVTGIWVLSQLVSWSPVYERKFSKSDPLISFSHRKNQVGSATNHFLALFGPLAVFFVVGALKKNLLLIHHAAIGVWASRGLARLVTQVLKHSVGRLRPDFLARCKWNHVMETCSGKAQDVIDGRKSFPSGHSSTAFSGMVFLSLWIAGQTAAWCFSTPKSPGRLRSSRIALFLLTLFPLFWATHVAVTRIQDHRHHKEDVIVGSFVGILSGLICYLIFWPSPFHASTFHFENYGQPRILYTRDDYGRPRVTEFELAQSRLDEDGENTV